MNRRRIKEVVDAILAQHEQNALPIDVEKIAEAIGAEIRRDEFEEKLSGFAYQKLGAKYIGINSTEGEERQRFTIAHELGHIFLHKQHTVNYDQGMIMLRDHNSSAGTDIKEIEANRFAAELLMPEDLLRSDLAKIGDIDLVEDNNKVVKKLAAKYNVSKSAMSVRLTTLYFN